MTFRFEWKLCNKIFHKNNERVVGLAADAHVNSELVLANHTVDALSPVSPVGWYVTEQQTKS